MQIVCPQCGTSYEVADASMQGGRVVRCATCRHVWLAGPTLSEVVGQAAAGPSEAAPQAPRNAAWPEPQPSLPDEMDHRAPEPTEATASIVPDGHAATGQPDPVEVPPGDPEPVGEPPVIENAPPLLPEPDEGRARAATGDLAADDESTAADDLAALRAVRRKRAARRRRMPRPSAATVILSLLVVLAAILAWRTEVVRAMPQTASLFAKIGLPVNLRGLAFKDVRIEKDSTENVTVLVVLGTIANVVRRRVEVPRLRFAVRDRSGTELHGWTALPAIGSLGPGELLDFRTRLASPPAGTADVQVRFFNNRRDR